MDNVCRLRASLQDVDSPSSAPSDVIKLTLSGPPRTTFILMSWHHALAQREQVDEVHWVCVLSSVLTTMTAEDAAGREGWRVPRQSLT